jgi:hypothetical protein
MNKINLSFKKEIDGTWDKYRTCQIKINKIVVGEIVENRRDRSEEIKIKLMVIKSDIMEDGNPNCIWKWITFKKTFESEELAKIWFKENIEGIMGKWNIFIDREGG